ncbi:MAG: AAA domain-containing protein, partial [Clostridiales bacterium]
LYNLHKSENKKIFENIINKYMTFKNRRFLKKLDEIESKRSINSKEYSNLYKKYKIAYNNLKDKEFKNFYNCRLLKNEIIKKLNKQKITKNNLNILNKLDKKLIFFDNYNLEKALKYVEEEYKKTNNLIDELKEWRESIASKQNYALNELLLETVEVVGATCIGVNSQKRFSNLDFDVTIIDEAGQIQIHNVLVPMSVSNKLIMLGDYNQIPPILDSTLSNLCESNDVKKDYLEISLFEDLYKKLPDNNKIMLDSQYRIPAEIADIISDHFYNGNYKSHILKKNMCGVLQKISKKTLIIIDTSKKRERYEEIFFESGCKNKLEAKIIVDLVKYINNERSLTVDNIGIISAYKLQVNLISKNLQNFFDKDMINEIVASLDSFQGQERDIIIYSFTRSSNRNKKHLRIGFLKELRRLNVAMTRCKKTLVLIGDMNFLSNCENNKSKAKNKSEKNFSDFIGKIIKVAKEGKGELIEYDEFYKRLRS